MPRTSSITLPRDVRASAAGERFDAPTTSGRRRIANEALVTGPRNPSGRAGVRAPTGSTRSTKCDRDRPSPHRDTQTAPSGPGTAGTSASISCSRGARSSTSAFPLAPFPLRWNACVTAQVIRRIFAGPGRMSRRETNRSLLTQRYFSSKPQGVDVHAETRGALMLARRLPLAIHGLSVCGLPG